MLIISYLNADKEIKIPKSDIDTDYTNFINEYKQIDKLNLYQIFSLYYV